MRVSSGHQLGLFRTFVVLLGLGHAGCSSGSKSSAAPTALASGSEFSFESDTYAVPAGTEKYMCFTKKITEDMWVDKFSHGDQANVHHLVLVRTLAPESDEPFECPVFFKTTWIPLFATGTSDAELVTPSGSSFSLPKGTQLLLQLHLLNAGVDTATGKVDIAMRKVAKTPSEAGVYGFGTTLITLPPGEVTTVKNDCVVKNDVDVFAVFPHMHTLGKSLTFETGPDPDHLTQEYEVHDWDFGNQFIAPHPLHLYAGEATRTTCTYDNTRSQAVTFGESTENEMCFFTAFRTNYQGLDGCVELGGWKALTPGGGDGGAAPDSGPNAGGTAAECAAVTGNEKGIGASCTKGGGECKSGLSCSIDLNPGTETTGFCMQVGGCTTATDCGSAASCCAPAQGGGAIKICMPEACRPADCTPTG